MKQTEWQKIDSPDPRLELVAESLALTGRVRVRVYGVSMRPAIHPGDIVNIRTCTYDELRRGDIVACIRNAGLVVHRLVRKANGRLWLKGDTLPLMDPPMPHGLLFGRVEGVESAAGYMDLSTRGARRANLLVMAYMLPVSMILALARKFRAPAGPNRDSQHRPLSRGRRILEWLPRRVVRGLITKNRGS